MPGRRILDLFEARPKFPDTLITPYIIAEAGVNHEGSLDLAKRLIEEAAEAGADAIKFQTYKAETIASENSPAYWDLSKEPTDSQFKLFKKHDKFWKAEFEQLKVYCEAVGIEFMSTPFDIESANFLNDMMDVFKISSSDLNNEPFVRHIAAFHKPIILSTGASHMWEVEQTVSWIRETGNDIALLHCILNYPTADENANLAVIGSLIKKFPEYVIGYSDHTLPKNMKTLEVATLLGARIIEKHFTHDKTLPGNDHYHAMDKLDLAVFLKNIGEIGKLLGSSLRRPIRSENVSRENARRSIVAANDIPSGKLIDQLDLTFKRPGNGLDPRYLDEVIGMRARQEITADTVLKWSMLE
jgi:sialic acid synthase SpsE